MMLFSLRRSNSQFIDDSLSAKRMAVQASRLTYFRDEPILGANFSSESGPEIPLNLSLLIRFGGHVTMKKGTRWLLRTKKGATCGISPPLLAPTESPKRFPNRPSTPMVQRVSPVLLPVQRLPPPATAFPTPGAGYPPKATPSQGRAGGGEAGCGRARLGLDWCG